MRNDLYLKQLLTITIQELGIEQFQLDKIEVEIPVHETFGDYSTNIALKLFKNAPKESYHSPLDFANKIAGLLSSHDFENRFESFTTIMPGFINAKLSKACLINTLINKEPKSLANQQSKKVLVEFVGPNTNKQLHIGHVLNAVLGHALINILRRAGQNVTAGTISNDRGIHIMKSMYGYLKCAHQDAISKNQDTGELSSIPIDTIDYQTILHQWLNNPREWKTPKDVEIKPDHFIGWCYIQGNALAENSPEAQEEMQKMLRAWEDGDADVRTLWMQTNTWFYEGYHQTLHQLNMYASLDRKNFFDHVWYESEVYKRGKEIILNNIGNGLIKEYEDGHVEAELEDKFNIPNIVLLRKDKSALYITQDIELLRNRLEDFKFDQVVYVVDYRQTLQFNQLFKIVASFGFDKANDCIHKAYGEVRTPQGPMSSRKGNIITADWLINETEKRAYNEINEERGNVLEEEKLHIAHQVALGALKYGLLKFNSSTNIIFDIDKNTSFEGDTGPYIQYTHARCASILNKTNENYSQDLIEKQVITSINQDIANLDEEWMLLRKLEKFEKIIHNAANQMSPNIICEYIFDISQKFNNIYASKSILKETDEYKKYLRIFTAIYTKKVLHEGLELLGIFPLQKM